jgi:antitoxin (DNA-binding transcriptional repressor) of toxin-antitoxin stability system
MTEAEMTTITLQEAQTTLPELIHRLPAGEGVVITENDKPVAQLIVPLMFGRAAPRPRPPVTGIPKAGALEGLLVVPDDFKEPLEELREYME